MPEEMGILHVGRPHLRGTRAFKETVLVYPLIDLLHPHGAPSPAFCRDGMLQHASIST